MKIGEFAAKHDITIDTIRHYMDLGLMVPEKVGGQYLFEESASKDLENIIELKELGFSLAQIQEIIIHERAGRFRFLSEWEYYHNFFSEKKKEIKKEVELFLRQLDKLDKRLKDIEDLKPAEEYPAGVPISFLNHACCPKCKGRLSMSKASIEENMIVNGSLKCFCGFNINIIDGIIVLADNGHWQDPSSMEVFFNEYFKNTDNQYLSLLYKGMEWITKRLGLEKAGNEIILELGTGWGFFLNNIQDKIKENTLYIAVDHNLQALRYTKRRLERANHNKNIVFICTDFSNIPLKDEVVDVTLDIGGSFEYNLIKPGYIIPLVDRHLRKGSRWLGTYAHFNANASVNLISKELQPYFKLSNIKKGFIQANYKEIESKDIGYADKRGEYGNFITEGEKTYFCCSHYVK